MKTIKTLMSLFVLVAAFSCAKGPSTSEGRLEFAVYADELVADVTKSNVSDYAVIPQATDFDLVINDASGALYWSGTLSNWDPSATVAAGEYTVTASYGNLEDEGFDKPYFTGQSNFIVKGGETVEVSVPVTLGNTIVKVECTEDFRNYYKDYTFRLVRGSAEIATFGKDETRAAFIDGYKIALAGTVKTETGAEKGFEWEYSNLLPATAYTVIIDVSNVGGSAVTISFNNTVETVELGDVELND